MPIAWVKASPVVGEQAGGGSGRELGGDRAGRADRVFRRRLGLRRQAAERAFDVVRVERADERADDGHAECSRNHPRDGVRG